VLQSIISIFPGSTKLLLDLRLSLIDDVKKAIQMQKYSVHDTIM
jgi:hypothetical protein